MSIEIYNADCRAALNFIAPKTISAVISSPPFNSNIHYNEYKDSLPEEEYLLFLGEVFESCKRCLKDDGSFFLNIGARPSNQGLQFKVISKFSEYFNIQNSIVWVKSVYTRDKTSGHVKPINSNKYFNPCHELLLHGVKDKHVPLNKLNIGVPYTDKSNIERWSGKQDLKDRGNTWFLPYSTVKLKKKHPAAFPPELPECCIKVLDLKEDDIVLDPFCGEGNSALACKRAGVSFIGFDIDEEYVQMARELVTGE